jgi:hypothetical protein
LSLYLNADALSFHLHHQALTVYTQLRGRPQQKIAVGGDESAEPVDGAAEDPVKEVTIVN